ncbi:MAG TPA: DUF6431 domain-containing protein [Acidimicrobiales bacterium]|nr:DUF6431 domain-containing protein [Acidimicrobiales bacterium]
MAIVWSCPLGVDAYASAGRDLDVPRMACPDCATPMGLWGWRGRDLRAGQAWRLWVRRQRCRPCGRSHVVLPAFVTHGRLDEVEVIGAAVETMVGGAGARPVARALGLPHTTVRDWRRRFSDRAALLAAGLAAAAVALVGAAPRLAADPERAAVEAVGAVWRALVRARRRVVGRRWAVANAVCGGHLLSTNTHPPWAAA